MSFWHFSADPVTVRVLPALSVPAVTALLLVLLIPGCHAPLSPIQGGALAVKA